MKLYYYNDIKDLNPYDQTDWRRYFFQYMVTREGFLLTVYKDIYGYYTVGIGHLLSASDNIPMVEGYTITKDKVIDLFKADMTRLNIETYAAEIFNVNAFKKIGLSSFIWAHGDGQYKGGQTRQLIKTTDNETTIRNKISQWDATKPANQLRNNADFDMFFTGVSDLASGLVDFSKILSIVKDNAGGIAIAIGVFFLFS